MKIAIVASKFNKRISENLVIGAKKALKENALENPKEFWVPGAFELPLACKWLSSKYDGLVAIGTVIRGETNHYDHVANVASDGIAEVSRNQGIPIGFGLITAKNVDQALARSSDNDENLGYRAVKALIEMINLRSEIDKN